MTRQQRQDVDGGEQPRRSTTTTTFMSLSRRISSLSSFSSYSTTTTSSSSSPSRCGSTNSLVLLLQNDDLSQHDDDYVRYMKKSDGDDHSMSDTALPSSTSSSSSSSSFSTTRRSLSSSSSSLLSWWSWSSSTELLHVSVFVVSILLPVWKTIQCQIQNTIYNFCDNGLPWKKNKTKKNNNKIKQQQQECKEGSSSSCKNVTEEGGDVVVVPTVLLSCRSFWSGGTGILFSILPNIVLLRRKLYYSSNHLQLNESSTDPSMEIQLLVVCWLIQGILSVLADYVYIDVNHMMHGIDRIWSMCMYCYMIYQSYYTMSLPTLFLLNAIAGSAYIVANSAKKVEVGVTLFSTTATNDDGTMIAVATTNNHIQRWMYYHGIWHIVGSTVSMIVMYLVYDYCPSTATASTASAVATSYHHSSYYCSNAIY